MEVTTKKQLESTTIRNAAYGIISVIVGALIQYIPALEQYREEIIGIITILATYFYARCWKGRKNATQMIGSLLVCFMLMGCAFGAGQSKRSSTISGCNDVTVAYRRIASGGMNPPEGAKTSYSEDLGLTIDGVPVKFNAGQESNGYFLGASMKIEDCTKVQFIYEEALSDTIGVDIPQSLGKLWIPSEDPDLFGDKEWAPDAETYTEE